MIDETFCSPEMIAGKLCSSEVDAMLGGDKLSLEQGPRNNLESEQMKNISYASAVESLMYAQVCTRPDIICAMGMLGRYQSNLGLDHRKAAKKVMRYLQGTKDYKLTYRRSDHLEVIGYSYSDFTGCLDSRKSTSGYIFLLARGVISWRSVKMATSTAKAEFVAYFKASSQAIWLRSYISGLKIVDTISKPLKDLLRQFRNNVFGQE
ncbi:secreted RxLR effector protein 161-like [Aristolochia californica]|uniref:secreted RxLR effector protein 161-like n=1 Tax=Aristolochia californica TaxID=171875 RepID=UPI0035DFB602